MSERPLHAVKAYRQAKADEVGEEKADEYAERFRAAMLRKLKDLGIRPDWPDPPRP